MNAGISTGAEALDNCVIALHRAARESSGENFQEQALERMGTLVPCDFAVWSRAAFDNGIVRLYGVYDLRLPAGALQAQASIADRDVLGAAAFASLGRTVIASPATSFTQDSVTLDTLIKPFDLGHFLTTCLLDPFTSLISSLTLIRRERGPLFTQEERLTKERLTPHLVEAYTTARLMRLLQGQNSEQPYACAVATICDAGGLIEFASARFAERMREEWPDWRGPRLPNELLAFSEVPFRRVLGQVTAFGESSGGAFQLRIRKRHAMDDLSAREVQVAQFSARGYSNKEIGKTLSISPFTVRNHLENVYRKLAVSNRNELGATLHGVPDPVP